MQRRSQARHWARDEIARLDVEADYARIAHLSSEVRYGDPILTSALYLVAFLRQMAVPSIAAVVHRGGRSPIITGTRKRNDDTMVFFGEFLRNGPASERGQAAIARLNEIHASFPITNDQSLYTLASLTFDAVRVTALLGLDPLTAPEKQANLRFWRAVGVRMGIDAIPDDYDEYLEWTLAYEREQWAWTAGGEAVARAMLDDYAARWFPPAWRRVGRELAKGFIEDELLDALHLRRPTRATRALVAGLARGYFLARRVLPDPADRSWVDDFGGAYGACPHLADLGYHRSPVEPTRSASA